VFVIVELRLCVVLTPGQVVQFSRTIVLPSAPVVAAISQNSTVQRSGLCWVRTARAMHATAATRKPAPLSQRWTRT
jgi:hypothetical protein